MYVISITCELWPWFDLESEGMVQVVETDMLAVKAKAIGNILEADVAVISQKCQMDKKRTVKVKKSSKVCVHWSLDLSVSFTGLTDNGEAVNKAEVFLLPEELPVFTLSLLQHPILLPTNYSQQVSMERGMYCMRIIAEESPENFAQRLSDTLQALEKESV